MSLESRLSLLSRAPISRASFHALGTTCELLAVDRSSAELAHGAAWVAAMERRLTRFDPRSELSLFNASAGQWVAVSWELEELLLVALHAYRVSDGLVHAGVLRCLLAAGYTRPFRQGPTSPQELRRLALPALPEQLEVRRGRARLATDAGIDLGGLAKGWLADRLCERLGGNVLANLGGDLFARGAGPDALGWPVGFGGRTALLRDAGAATSGTWRRRWGEGLHHLIDPRTGVPARTDLREVSVVAASAAEAEVLAKAALLKGSRVAAGYLEPRAFAWTMN